MRAPPHIRSLADKYVTRDGLAPTRAAPLREPVHVDDITYPDMRAALLTLRAYCGSSVHHRNLVGALAIALGENLEEWDGGSWRKTIKPEWIS